MSNKEPFQIDKKLTNEELEQKINSFMKIIRNPFRLLSLTFLQIAIFFRFFADLLDKADEIVKRVVDYLFDLIFAKKETK